MSTKLMFRLLLLIITTFINVLIMAVLSIECLNQLVLYMDKHVALVLSMLVAVFIQAYLIFYSKIRFYIKDQK